MNGISGCSARSSASSTSSSVRRVPRFGASVAVADCSTGFVSSRYQSQNSYQVNSYSRGGREIEAIAREGCT